MHEGHRERLRKRFRESGLIGFAEHELLELLLTYAIPRRNTNDIAHALLVRFGSLEKLFMAEESELMRVPGIGESAAVFLRLHGQLLLRLRRNSDDGAASRPRLNSPAAAARYALQLVATERYECVFVISLDKRMRLLHAERLLSGTLNEAPLYPRRVVESALQNRAHAVLLLHNHPSGDATPSKSDLAATKAVQAALNGIDILLHDHLIAGRNVAYSCLRGILIEPADPQTGAALHVELPPWEAEEAGERAAEHEE